MLHIYAQAFWHSPACIAGTQDALQSLRDAIDKAIESGRSKTEEFTNDGEGYHVHVLMVDEETGDRLSSPYMDPEANDDSSRKGVVNVWDLIRGEA